MSNCVIFFFRCLVTIITASIDLLFWFWAISFRVSSSRQPLHAKQAQLKYIGFLENNFYCPTFLLEDMSRYRPQICWPLRERAKRAHHRLDDNRYCTKFFSIVDLRALTGSNFRTTLLCLCYLAQQWSASILSSPPLPCSLLPPSTVPRHHYAWQGRSGRDTTLHSDPICIWVESSEWSWNLADWPFHIWAYPHFRGMHWMLACNW